MQVNPETIAGESSSRYQEDAPRPSLKALGQSVNESMSILQYLANYAEPESGCAPPSDRHYEDVVVIPAFDEEPSFLDALMPAGNTKTLWIVVINCSESRSDAEKDRTRDLAKNLGEEAQALAWPGVTLRPSSRGDILAIDRCHSERMLPARQGVGLARKIGCDLALTWQRQGSIESPWIHCTDADVTLPADYFSAARALDEDRDVAALCYPFWHECEQASRAGRALGLYEMSLRYYVLGLRWAGSPYAHHNIGSTMAIRSSAYLQVRGVPKREAGEDFYLLNKVAKIGSVVVPRSDPLLIKQRHSQRTPFGTGPATAEIESCLHSGDNFSVYNPRSFALLREWLATMDAFCESCDLGLLDLLSSDTLRSALPLDTEKHLRLAARQAKSPRARAQRLQTWFDGFRSLKLIHALRERGLVDVPWQEAFDSAPFVPQPMPGEGIRAAMARFEKNP